jgi:adenylate kinase
VHGDHVETVSFGQLLYQETTARTPMTYREFRAAAAGIVTDLRTASDALAARAAAARGDGQWLIVESHAVAREASGWQAHPDPPGVLARYRYDILVYLDAPASVILGRIHADQGSQLARDQRDIAVLSAMQMAVAVGYSAALGIPLNVIDADTPASTVTAAVASVLGLPDR